MLGSQVKYLCFPILPKQQPQFVRVTHHMHSGYKRVNEKFCLCTHVHRCHQQKSGLRTHALQRLLAFIDIIRIIIVGLFSAMLEERHKDTETIRPLIWIFNCAASQIPQLHLCFTYKGRIYIRNTFLS